MFTCSAPGGLLVGVWAVGLLLFLYHLTFPRRQRRRIRRQAVFLHAALFVVLILVDAGGRTIEWGCTLDLLIAPLRLLGGA